MKSAKKLSFWAKFRRLFLSNFYEGAVRWSPNRSFILEEPARDARLDITKWDLDELIRKNRYYSKNGPAVYIRLQGLFAQYTVGSEGIKIVPATSDMEFNAAVAEAWAEACENLEVSGKSYSVASEEGANTLFCDGSYFIVKTMVEVPGVERGKPKMQPRIWMVERHRVGTPPSLSEQEGKTIFNGIQYDAKIQYPVAYWIKSGDGFTKWDADKVEHVFDSTRPGQIDGVPVLTPAINLLNDLSDLQALQMKKAKAAADVANMVFNAAGEMTDEDALRDETTVDTLNSTGEETRETRTKRLREAHGGSWSFFKTDEEVKQFKSESPSVTEQWHWRKTEADVCAIGGSSIQLVFPESIQGTVQRGDLEVVAATYRGWSCLQGHHWCRVYLWWLEWAKDHDARLKKKPDDYKSHEFRPPRGPDVDTGRNSKADIEELKAGLQPYSTYFSKRQMDYRQVLEQVFKEAALLKELAGKYGVKMEEAILLREILIQKEASNVPPKSEDDE